MKEYLLKFSSVLNHKKKNPSKRTSNFVVNSLKQKQNLIRYVINIKKSLKWMFLVEQWTNTQYILLSSECVQAQNIIKWTNSITLIDNTFLCNGL